MRRPLGSVFSLASSTAQPWPFGPPRGDDHNTRRSCIAVSQEMWKSRSNCARPRDCSDTVVVFSKRKLSQHRGKLKSMPFP